MTRRPVTLDEVEVGPVEVVEVRGHGAADLVRVDRRAVPTSYGGSAMGKYGETHEHEHESTRAAVKLTAAEVRPGDVVDLVAEMTGRRVHRVEVEHVVTRRTVEGMSTELRGHLVERGTFCVLSLDATATVHLVSWVEVGS